MAAVAELKKKLNKEQTVLMPQVCSFISHDLLDKTAIDFWMLVQ